MFVVICFDEAALVVDNCREIVGEILQFDGSDSIESKVSLI